jgi:hypothetical protein
MLAERTGDRLFCYIGATEEELLQVEIDSPEIGKRSAAVLHFKIFRLTRVQDIRNHKVLQMPKAKRPILDTPIQL